MFEGLIYLTFGQVFLFSFPPKIAPEVLLKPRNEYFYKSENQRIRE